MSHNRHTAFKMLMSAALLGALAMPVTANAAVHSPQGRSVVYKAKLSAVDGLDARILDWRNPSLEFIFDGSDTDWTDGVELLLSADPMGDVSRRTPLMVQFNNGMPTPVITRGRGFDARIKLDPAHIRPRNNKIRFTYDTPAGSECLSSQHGGWRLDFKNSLIIIKARAKVRNLDIREIDARLRNPMTAPKSVRILARGQNTSKLQVLAAQGVGLRMKELPEFKTRSGTGDFDIIVARRDQLSGWVTDKKILNGTGPTIFAHKGQAMRLVITGDTDTEVMETAKAFATYRLPDAHRSITSLGEMNMQPFLKPMNPRINGTKKLADIDGGYFENSWGPRPQTLIFDVEDPAASSGEILLRLAKNKVVGDGSRLSLTLNGKSLGYTSLNKTRKSVAFKIPEGTLQGVNNTLSLTPELEVGNPAGCNFTQDLPGFYLGNGSKLKIETAAPSPVAELSKLTATGAPFSLEKASDTVVMLPATSSRDYDASLKIMAKLAKSSGHGWTEANYMRAANLKAVGTDKNVLVIGPSSRLNKTIKDAAPKGLKSALKGLSLDGPLIASLDRVAASDETTTLNLYAQSQAAKRRIRNGGVAALYPSPLGEGKVMGIITNVPGRSFANVAGQLVKPAAWSKMEGSVARWDNAKVIMAQTALDVPGFKVSSPPTSKFGGFKWPEIKWPSFDKKRSEFGEIDTSSIRNKFEDVKLSAASLLSGKKTRPEVTNLPTKVAATVAAPRLKPQASLPAIPNLRGMSTVQTASGAAKMKTWATTALGNAQAKTKALGETIKVAFDNVKTSAAQPSTWSHQTMNSFAIILIASLAFIFMLLGLIRPSRGAQRRVRAQKRVTKIRHK